FRSGLLVSLWPGWIVQLAHISFLGAAHFLSPSIFRRFAQPTVLKHISIISVITISTTITGLAL
ncbi:MAG: hypothetical protein ABIL62_10445, partial [Planctomycetota bacterium]